MNLETILVKHVEDHFRSMWKVEMVWGATQINYLSIGGRLDTHNSGQEGKKHTVF